MTWLLPALLAFLGWQAPESQTHVVVITGLGGTPHHSANFHRLATTLVDAVTHRFGVPGANVIYLAGTVDGDSARIDGRASKENVEAVLRDLAARARPGDQVFICLLGHGTASGGQARFNLPGPDMTPDDFAPLLAAFGTQRLVFANTASASGGFVATLSGPNRTIIAATKSGFEQNETVFGDYFVEAFTGDDADGNKDDRVSILEAFEYARTQVAREYQTDKRLLTEHALLDDNGDGQWDESDGASARRFFLTSAAAMSLKAGDDPELADLYRDRQRLQDEIEALRGRKDGLPATEYEAELERLLVDLAVTSREIRDAEARR